MVLRALALLILFLPQPSAGETRLAADGTDLQREIQLAQKHQLAEDAKRKDGQPAGHAPGAVRPQAPELTGFWSGRVHQPGYATYSMNVFFQDHITALVYYPELKCGGELQRLREQPGAVVFQETLTQGTGACETSGTVVFQPLRNNAMSWKWYYPGGRLGSTARLRRIPGMGAEQIRARIRRPVAGH
jgi:hypothetical protein